jgi:hypothetical protein
MGILLGQLPPAELARLKAELAETLIANFCYPRFYDYRTGSLRMRPVDRTKRQEVWLYLSSVDFTTWNRVDVMSPDFQRYVEHLFIQFVKRNRSFFGEQGRKRMPDVRTLITSSATAVTEGLRGHLTGHRTTNQPFGSPRPVPSWATSNATGRPEPNWEQVVHMTMLLQQQLQEVRGEVKAAPPSEARPMPTSARRVTRARATANGTSPVEQEMPSSVPAIINIPAPKESVRTTLPLPEPKRMAPLSPSPAAASASAPTELPSVQKDEDQVVTPKELPSRRVVPPRRPAEQGTPRPEAPEQKRDSAPAAVKQIREVLPQPQATAAPAPQVVSPREVPSQTQAPVVPARGVPAQAQSAITQTPPREVAGQMPLTSSPPWELSQPPVTPPAEAPQAQPPAPAPIVQVREVSQVKSQAASVPARKTESATAFIGNEDVAIFEQLRHQLIVWLRVEAVRSGADISGQGPAQLLEVLRQQESYDETRLQVVSTLLSLSNQVITSGHASLLDYKQSMMFYLMHTRR